MNLERDFRRFTVVLSIVSVSLGIIPAVLLGHWLLFLGATGAFVAMLWAGYYVMDKLYRKYGGSDNSSADQG